MSNGATETGGTTLPLSPCQDLQSRIDEVDRVLSNFGDIVSCTRKDAKALWVIDQSKNMSYTSPTMEQICDKYAPVNLRSQFEQVYRMLHPGLVVRRAQCKTNASVFLQGSRGSGKSLVLDQCLEAFRDELTAVAAVNGNSKPSFRIVHLNGILVPGSQVNLVVQEILRQLTTAAYEEGKQQRPGQRTKTNEMGNIGQDETQKLLENNDDDDNDEIGNNDDQEEMRPKKRNRKQILSTCKELSRLRKTSFTNHIQLLNEILQYACVDDIPILFVLDELDSFVGGGGGTDLMSLKTMETVAKDRQLLLYHLLDRVATGNSFISFVGLTCHHGTMNLLEKRIKSRAEGTKFVHFGPCQTLSEVSNILLDKIQRGMAATTTESHLSKVLSTMFTRPPDEGYDPLQRQVYKILQRSQRLGNDVRWFCRVFHMAFAAYRHDCLMRISDCSKRLPPLFTCRYLLDALVSMGGAFLTEASQHDFVAVNGVCPDARIQALRDLSGPQTALVFAARRILSRETLRETSDLVALTLERILDEYKTYRGSTNRYSASILRHAFDSLMDMGLLRPAMDHSGRAPFQYEHDASFTYDNMAPQVLARMPLHLNVDIHRELKMAMQKDFFDCSTALKEWAKKGN